MRGVFAGFVAATALVLALPACAGAPSGGVFYVTGMAPLSDGGYEARRTTVDFGALDPASPENAAVVLSRLQQAAVQSCTKHQFLTHHIKEKIQRCEHKALTEAVAALNVSAVTRLANAN